MTRFIFTEIPKHLKQMPTKVKYFHFIGWFGGILALNWPGSAFTMGVFYSSDYSLLIASLYGVILNSILFYGTLILTVLWFRADIKGYTYRLGILFLITSLIEMILDLVYYYLFYGVMEEWVAPDVIIGTLLLNGIFFLVPGVVFGIIQDWKSVEFTTPPSKIIIKDGAKELFVDSSDLFFIKSDGNYVVYHTSKRKIMTRESLSSIVKQLPDSFVRCHRSYIVNRALIEKKTYDQIEISGQKIPIGRTYLSVFK